jgi:TPR repeat protein
VDSAASPGAPGDATAEPTALPAPDEINDDDERRRGANFFAGMDAYEQADYDRALRHWLPLAENGHAAAQAGVGAVYYIFEQHADAFRWSRAAARQGESDAAYNLAVLYQYALGAPLSMTRAMLWYGEAAARGHQKATLALRELRGGPLAALLVPVPIPKPDPAESFDIRRLAEEAQILLATLGYNPGAIDGRVGARTRAAVEHFEQDRGLFIRGRVNEALLANLRRAIVEASATVISTR